MSSFSIEKDQFGGITILEKTFDDTHLFENNLKDSLTQWKKDGITVVWIKIPQTNGDIIPIVLNLGFDFHHCNGNILVLVKKLLMDTPIPSFASHHIGAGGVVTNSKNELLVVSEKYRSTKKAFFKLPGGIIQLNETIEEGVQREIFEETGINAIFEHMVCFRHQQKYRFGMPDIYFVCKLSATSTDISKQDSEIDECIWIPIQKYIDSPEISDFNRAIVQLATTMNGWNYTKKERHDGIKYEFFYTKFLEK